ncbi:MAG: hypothetical protein AABY81_04555 [Pseudomonadota bacterium]
MRLPLCGVDWKAVCADHVGSGHDRLDSEFLRPRIEPALNPLALITPANVSAVPLNPSIPLEMLFKISVMTPPDILRERALQ